MKIKLENKLIK